MSQSKKAPAYQWFVKDWRSSRATMRMSMAERGVYREMLDEQWEERSLPDSAEEVADIIATTDVQRAEVLAAWPVVRRNFVEGNGAPGRIYNVRLERARKEFKEFQRGQQNAGKIRAASAVRGGNGTFQQASSQSPAGLQPVTSVTPAAPPAGTSPASASSSASASASARDPRARGGAMAGSLPREHLGHVFCDDTFSRCVPQQVHDKLANLLAPKHGGDRQAAKDTLLAWYSTVAAGLPAIFVMGDAFKFWQARFDAAFSSTDTATVRPFGRPEAQITTPGVAETQVLLRSLKGGN